MMMTMNFTGEQFTIDLSGQEPGFYFIEIKQSGINSTLKLIKK
jgi:hypothetical protein